MSFSDIKLPETVIAEIYKNSLVELTGTENKKPAEYLPSLQYLGKNLQNILVYVNYPEEVYLPAGQLEFLGKILAACKLDMGDIAIVNRAKQQGRLEDYVETLQPKTILVFDNNAPIPGGSVEMTFFTPPFLLEIAVMNAPDLEKISEDSIKGKQLKNKLWNSLKQFFNI